jgi:chromosome segregation ATPase
MTMFGKDPVNTKLIERIEHLSKQVAELDGKLAASKERLKLADDVVGLKKQISKLEIERAQKQEEHDRREREVRHEVGLLRKQTETEQELATERAKLEVREENLQADRSRFEEQMKFTTARFEKEVEYLHNLAGQILERLPHVEVNKRLNFSGEENGNGHAEPAEVD